MSADPDDSTPGHGDLVHMLQRAIAVAKRRRRYRIGLALIGLAAMTTFAALGVLRLVSS